MSSDKFVVTVSIWTELDEVGRTVYPVLNPDPIEFPNLNEDQRNRLIEACNDGPGFIASWEKQEVH